MVSTHIQEQASIVVVSLRGELTASQSEGFVEELHDHIDREKPLVAVDLSEVTLIDSTGLSLLMTLVSRARLANGAVVLVSPTKFVRSIFAVTKLDTWFDMADSLEEAKEKLGA